MRARSLLRIDFSVYPSDVVASALLGSAAALLLWQPAVRGPLHGLADWGGRTYDAALERALRRLPRTVT